MVAYAFVLTNHASAMNASGVPVAMPAQRYFWSIFIYILHLSGIVPDKTYCKYYDEADHVECHTGKYDAKYSDSEIRHYIAVVWSGGGLFGSHAYHYTGLSTYRTFIYVLLVNCCIINKRPLRQVRLSGWQPVVVSQCRDFSRLTFS